MTSRTVVLQYIIDEYFDGSIERASAASSYPTKQIQSWLAGERKPQKKSIEYLIHCVFTPEFKIVAEFADFDPDKSTSAQLKKMLSGHEDKPGIYAFYDSMANLLYVGKAGRLFAEIYQQIRAPATLKFPKGVKTKPTSRLQLVRYVSAYDVGVSNWMDYPKHVEALLLRISKPPLNKNIGNLSRVLPP